MNSFIEINGCRIGQDYPCYIVAEISGNHNQDFQKALQLIKAAKEAGADAIKLQTYTPDTITINSNQSCFRITGDTLWDGKTLYELYQEAYTPWDWQPKLKDAAKELGIDIFSSPFDKSAIDFLANLDMPAYKIASFEIVDLPLIEYAASKNKPLILSTGMATLDEIERAVGAAKKGGAPGILLLKCTSAYPAPLSEMNLSMIPFLQKRFDVPVGLSDHSPGHFAASLAVPIGACMIEKHFILSRKEGGPDSEFSLEPDEFRLLVENVRLAEQAFGKPEFESGIQEKKSLRFRRSLFVVQDIQKGETFTHQHVRSIRPADGLPPRYYDDVIGRKAARDLARGTPLSWDDILGR